jgi:hypothetical protein
MVCGHRIFFFVPLPAHSDINELCRFYLISPNSLYLSPRLTDQNAESSLPFVSLLPTPNRDSLKLPNIAISLPLHKNAESVPVQARRRSALESWDADFAVNVTAAAGKIQGGPSSQRPAKGRVWEVIYCSTTPVDVNVTSTSEFGPPDPF